jgi:putative transposase
VAAKETGVIIHAVCVMSNHYHILVSVPGTRVAEFYGWVHKYVAKAINASYGRFENLWSSEKASVIVPESGKDLLDKVIYTLSNPVAARLVANGEQWPGVWLYKRSHSRIVERPEVYFRDDGDMPESVQLTIKPPSQFRHLGFEKFEKIVAKKLVEKAEKIAKEMTTLSHSFLGVRGIMQQRPTGKPSSREKRFGINPKVAAKNKWLRIEALQRNKEFLFQYREALKRWRNGDREVLFPAGTYALRVHSSAKCEPG